MTIVVIQCRSFTETCRISSKITMSLNYLSVCLPDPASFDSTESLSKWTKFAKQQVQATSDAERSIMPAACDQCLAVKVIIEFRTNAGDG